MPTLASLERMAPPITPGCFLAKLLKRCGVTQEQLSDAAGTSRLSINEIVNGKRAVTPAMAIRLAKATNTSIDIWLNLQRDVDLFNAFQKLRPELNAVTTIQVVPFEIVYLD